MPQVVRNPHTVPYLTLVNPRTKKPPRNSNKGRKTEVYTFKSPEDIKAVSSYLYHKSSDTPAYRYRNYLFFSLGINMGFRASDLCQLRWRNIFLPHTTTINTNDWNYLIEEKTKKSRQVVLNSSAIKAVKLYLESMSLIPEALDPDTFIFQSRKSTTDHVHPDTMRVILKDAAKACGVPFNVGTHSMRKTFGYNLYNSSGHDIAMVQHLLNHSSQEVTTHYIGIDYESTRAAYERLDDLVWTP